MENCDKENNYLNINENEEEELNSEESITETTDTNSQSEVPSTGTTENSNQATDTQTVSNSINNDVTIPEISQIIVNNESVLKERNLVLQLLDSKNKAIANKKISIYFNKKLYSNITNKYGRVILKISSDVGKYTVKVKFAGDENYTKCNKTFTLNVYKLNTDFTIPKTAIIRGHHFYAYLNDENGNPLTSKYVIIKYRNKTYVKKTNSDGRFRLHVKAKPCKYKTELIYMGSGSYIKTSKEITIISYKAKTQIGFNSKGIVRGKYLHIILYYHNNKTLANKKLTINFADKKYERTTNEEGKVKIRLTQTVGTYKIKVNFNGTKGYIKSYRSAKIEILPNYTGILNAKSRVMNLNGKKTVRYFIKLTDLNGNPIVGESIKLKTKCNNFTSGTGRKITKKTIVLSSDNIYNKKLDKQRLNQMAKLLRAKGYKVIVYGIGPSYHVYSVKNFKNVCVFSLVGGIDSGMFVDMASSYYQHYLKKNNNQFVLGCFSPTTSVNLANRTWLKRAHDDDYSPKSFKGMYFTGRYLNKKTHVDYVYGSSAKELVNNFLKYAKKGKSIGYDNTIPNRYTTYKLTTSKNGYVHIDLPIGNHTIICSVISNTNVDSITRWVNVVKK